MFNIFHKSGAATWKALSPVVLANLISGLPRVVLPTDLRLYLDCLKDKRLVIHVGAVPCTALKVNKISLKIILNLTGSQWTSTVTGVMCE